MKFALIEPESKSVRIDDFADLHAAERAIGLNPLKTNHGVAARSNTRGIGIVVYEYGLFVPAVGQNYFAIERHVYAGSAVLYAFNPEGCTIDFELPLPFITWFNNPLDVEHAIHREEIERPTLKLNGYVIWSWPAEAPPEFRAAVALDLANKRAGVSP